MTGAQTMQTAALTETSTDYLGLSTGGEDFVLPLSAIREIRSFGRATPLPHRPAWVLGVVNLRGTILPVIDLGRRLGLAADDDAGTLGARPVIVVVEDQGRPLGIAVARVRDITRIADRALEPPPACAAGPGGTFLRALAVEAGTVLRVLDPARLAPGPEGNTT
ncbi:chemotaxis protein CheW [Frigidibacter sp. SD6-1]|uniref:chemotaxis protein CheW n=1 Tax=Frigidibacter sp. SD6-1 TaxID=3032581 RepID=UPI0024E03C8B|nr:chemotaxis protein CheW [Frigidibacter sp. SD6-1]